MMLCKSIFFFLIVIHLLLLEEISSKSNQRFPEAPAETEEGILWFFQSIKLIQAILFPIKLDNLGTVFSQAVSFPSPRK